MLENTPLAERLRPTELSDYIGQEHIIGAGTPLYKSIEQGVLPSILFWGPPGVGKTTLAQIIAGSLKRPFYKLSAINSGVKDIRDTIEKAEKNQFFNQPKPILFIDEIHRFSKSQQDALLGAVEKGTLTLIGATTENPSFEVNSALLSRSSIYKLAPLTEEHQRLMLIRALKEDVHLKKRTITISDYANFCKYSGGDGRRLLNMLELICTIHEQNPLEITDEMVHQVISENIEMYDKSGENHYDTISAFIKSIRGSDPNAALIYLAKMIVTGEDLMFICRRMVIAASEDIGLANPNALLIAQATMQAAHQLGMPEARIPMSQCAIYLACSPKSNSAYIAIDAAINLVKSSPNAAVPLHLRNGVTSHLKDLDYGKNYKYAHDHTGNFVLQEFMPKPFVKQSIFKAGQSQAEQKLVEQLKAFWKDHYEF